MKSVTCLITIILLLIPSLVFPQNVQSWLGRTTNSVMLSWGMPDVRIDNPNGSSTLIYKIVTTKTYNNQFSPAVGVNVGAGGRPIIVVTPNDNSIYQNNLSLICTIRFEINKHGIVTSVSKQGNGC